jgi:hypothetical protein
MQSCHLLTRSGFKSLFKGHPWFLHLGRLSQFIVSLIRKHLVTNWRELSGLAGVTWAHNSYWILKMKSLFPACDKIFQLRTVVIYFPWCQLPATMQWRPESDSLIVSVCLSIRVEHPGSHKTDFREILYCGLQLKPVEKKKFKPWLKWWEGLRENLLIYLIVQSCLSVHPRGTPRLP